MVNEKVIDKRAEGGHGFLRLEDAVSDDFGSEAEHALLRQVALLVVDEKKKLKDVRQQRLGRAHRPRLDHLKLSLEMAQQNLALTIATAHDTTKQKRRVCVCVCVCVCVVCVRVCVVCVCVCVCVCVVCVVCVCVRRVCVCVCVCRAVHGVSSSAGC